MQLKQAKKKRTHKPIPSWEGRLYG